MYWIDHGRPALLQTACEERFKAVWRGFKSMNRDTVPNTLRGLHDWFRVCSRLGSESDADYPLQVLYVSETRRTVPKRVSVRVQGVFTGGDLNPDGDEAWCISLATLSDYG